MRANVSGVQQIGGGNSADFVWQADILLSSFYHQTWQGASKWNDGSRWCSNFKNDLLADGTAATATATQGLNGRSKCTW